MFELKYTNLEDLKKGPPLAKELVQLIEKESQTEVSLGPAYSRAYFCAVAKGDVARAKAFATKIFEIRVYNWDSAMAKHNAEEHPKGNPMFNVLKTKANYGEEAPSGLNEEDFEVWLWADSQEPSG